MPIGPKDWSEIVKNLVSAAAVIVGGLWVLFQWDTMFPKTRADVQTAAASVRTDVSGAFSVQLGMGDGGDGPPFHAPGGDPAVGLHEYCAANPAASLMQTTPVFGQLKLKSASQIPVRARVRRILVSSLAIPADGVAPSAAPAGKAFAPAIRPVASVDDDGVFFGGLRENRVEKDQEVQVAVMFNAEIPLKCAELERLLLFQAEVALTAIDPARDRPIGPEASKVFVTACQLNPRTGPVCNVEGVSALGQ